MINMGEYDLMSEEELELVEIADCPSSEFW